jgi:hypothetical protein
MKKRSRWRLIMAIGLVGASILVYAFDYLMFREPRELFNSLVKDIAFLFVYILVVIIILEEVLSRREKRGIMNKMNMVIGTFFNDVGLEMLRIFPTYVKNAADLAPRLEFGGRWEKKDFLEAMEAARCFNYEVRVGPESLRSMRTILCSHREFLLRLLENPNLLEHDRFTELLWAVFHMMDELEMRPGDLENLPEADMLHLAGDVRRAYSQIASEWLAYAQHIKGSYPFLFSLAARINPFNKNASPIISA